MQIRKWLIRSFVIISITAFFPVQFAFAGNPPDAAQSTLSATSAGSDKTSADGTSQVSMTVTLKDSGAVALAGDSVSLSIPSDSTAVISPTSATLDVNGQAVFTITSTQVGTDNIDVTDTTTSTTLTALGSVIFETPPSNPSTKTTPTTCQSASPKNAPGLYQINMIQDTAVLYFAPPNDTYDGFTISYGLTQSANSYTTHFSQGASSGAISYTVNSLTPKSTYYFKVRADNGCAPGPWSQVVTPLTKLPVTGPNDIFITIGMSALGIFLTGTLLFLL